jgi:hypothetical protein
MVDIFTVTGAMPPGMVDIVAIVLIVLPSSQA